MIRSYDSLGVNVDKLAQIRAKMPSIIKIGENFESVFSDSLGKMKKAENENDFYNLYRNSDMADFIEVLYNASGIIQTFVGSYEEQEKFDTMYSSFRVPDNYMELEADIKLIKALCERFKTVDFDKLLDSRVAREMREAQKKFSSLMDMVEAKGKNLDASASQKTGDNLGDLFDNQSEKGKDGTKKQLN